MKTGAFSVALVVVSLALAAGPVMAIEEIPDKRLVSRGGVLYPQTGDSSQEIYKTPENARQMFPVGTRVGVLPADCTSASHGSVGNYYRCDHNFALKEEVLPDGRTVYLVIESP